MNVKLMEEVCQSTPDIDTNLLDKAIAGSWAKIAPFWPLKNLIAVNPLAGFEDFAFEEGLKQAQAYFQQKDLPEGMQNVNRASIKWLQAFFDEGESTIQMPNRHLGLLKSTLLLLKFDKMLYKNEPQQKQWLEQLPHKSATIIAEAITYLGIPPQKKEQFLTLMLTTLPGWAAHIKYRTNWADAQDADHPHPVTQNEYLALRLVLTCLLWKEAKDLLFWYERALKNADVIDIYAKIAESEVKYQTKLMKQLDGLKPPQQPSKPKAQLVFCIDVRSEPFRRALEAQGAYETYGFAGFFGVPVAIENAVTGAIYASCPVLLKPEYKLVASPAGSSQSSQEGHKRLQSIKKLYQSLKYTFTTPFSLVEIMGLGKGLWMGIRSLFPNGSATIQSVLKRVVVSEDQLMPDIQTIPFEQQVAYGAKALKMMGLTESFASLVVFCGHGSATQNNAYATALDCGACGGRPGVLNARILAAILNAKNVRKMLKGKGIEIPQGTLFVAAKHNTTTDEVEIYSHSLSRTQVQAIVDLKQDLARARGENSFWRIQEMGGYANAKKAQKLTAQSSKDWAQVRPEWGLSRNASFIIAPRGLTKDINLEGRSFLHSYEWEKDHDGLSLTTILTAPMIVAQWINAQYLFSTLDNVAFGSGSKTTKNITGKIGIIQGNASDLMHGLPLQAVFKSDEEAYHQPMRLTVIVYAPKTHIDPIINQNGVLQKLFGNGWIHLICHDPKEHQRFSLQRDLTWAKMS